MNLLALREDLLAWFDRHGRPLPWRIDRDPYRVWISEVMLQQTQAQTVIPYYQRFLELFPHVGVLQKAELGEVLKAWEGLGYYRRARHLHQAANLIVDRHGGQIPATEKDLLALPGIGRYTAGAILSIAYGLPYPVVDGNVKRVLSRLFDISDSIDEPSTARLLWQRAGELLDPEYPGPFNEALMELGATVCLPESPQCPTCPVLRYCLAYERGTKAARPVRSSRKPTPHYDVVAGVIRHRNDPKRFLISQRPPEGMLGGLWEFPGGKQEPGEDGRETLVRELREELGIDIKVGRKLVSIRHAYTHFRITLHAYHAQHITGEPQCLGVADWRWVTLTDLSQYPFPRTDQKIIAALCQQASSSRIPGGS